LKNLASAVIDGWWWTEQCREELAETFGDDFMVDHYEAVGSTLDDLDVSERQAIRDVARERLESYNQGPDEWGFSKRSQLTEQHRDFLVSLINYPEPRAEEAEGGDV
jgi:hypothetical protein